MFESRLRDMAYTKEQMREYQREWVRKRRDAFFADKECVVCESKTDLQLDHIDPATKVYSPASLWGMSDKNPKKIEELNKCQVLCKPCHLKKTNGIGGDLHLANLTVSATLVCSRGHDLRTVGYHTYTQPNGFVSKKCLYCNYVQRRKRRGQDFLDEDAYVRNKRKPVRSLSDAPTNKG